MSWDLWALAALITIAVVATSIWLLRVATWFTLGAWRARRSAGAELPLWIRISLPLANPIADAWGPRLPLPLRDAVHRSLRKAGLDDSLSAQLFVAVTALWAFAGALAMLTTPAPAPLRAAFLLALLAMPWVWLRDRRLRLEWEVLRDLPAYVDMLTLALEAGNALSTALRATTAKAPDGVLRRAFLRLQGELRAGRSRVDALRAMAERLDSPAVSPLIAAMIQTEQSGASLSAALRAQAQQRLDERFARAEKLALEAPVKMLAPLVLCIFPCTFLVLGFPIFVRIMSDWGGR